MARSYISTSTTVRAGHACDCNLSALYSPASIANIAGMARSYRFFVGLQNTTLRRKSLYEQATVRAGHACDCNLSTLYSPASIANIANMARSYRFFVGLQNTTLRRKSLYEQATVRAGHACDCNLSTLYSPASIANIAGMARSYISTILIRAGPLLQMFY